MLHITVNVITPYTILFLRRFQMLAWVRKKDPEREREINRDI